MRTVKILFYCHLAALLFGLGGLLIALPHPELWDKSPFAVEVFNFGIRYAGSLHILFGAAAVLLFGLLFVGARKTLIFFVVATTIPLGMELLGTSTGIPFGPYAYTDFLGFKIAGLVPYSIPLSWFYMGFVSFMLANVIVARPGWRHRSAWSLALGVYFLTAWDLSLDPAMASQRLPIHFWLWYQSGPYFGMPISNLVGWSLTGLVYMGISRLLWRANLDVRRLAPWFLFGMYAANTGFAIALNLSAGLWLPVLVAILFGLLPASLVLFLKSADTKEAARAGNDSIVKRISWFSISTASRALSRGRVQVVVEGLEHVPTCGPVMIVARHFHHLYDGCVLLQAVPRRLHILVALDWIKKRWQRPVMEWACAAVEWPALLRLERLGAGTETAKGSIYSRGEFRRYLRRAITDAIRLLRNGEVLVVFPEAYPNIDPETSPKKDEQAFLPFRPGFARLVELAEKDGRTGVALIPAGLTYLRDGEWQVTLRFGPPLFRRDYSSTAEAVQALEAQVRALSGPIDAPVSDATQEVLHS